MLFFRKLFSNPLSLFVYGILSKWYIAVITTALIVTFWVFKGLDEAGVIQATTDTLVEAFSDAKSIAKYCTPKITNLERFWNCIENPPKYQPSPDENQLEKSITPYNFFQHGIDDPYDY